MTHTDAVISSFDDNAIQIFINKIAEREEDFREVFLRLGMINFPHLLEQMKEIANNFVDLKERDIKQVKRALYAINQKLERLNSQIPLSSGITPPHPTHLYGRYIDYQELKKIVVTKDKEPRYLAVQGWPGVGKTSLVAKLFHDEEVFNQFAHPPLWATVGLNPDIPSILNTWASAVGVRVFPEDKENTHLLAGSIRTALLSQERLIVLDDLWTLDHFYRLNVATSNCVTVVTTRIKEIGERISTSQSEFISLGGLSAEHAERFLTSLTPNVVSEHRAQCLQLLEQLDFLPLGIDVAGRLMQNHATIGKDIQELLKDLIDNRSILNEEVIGDFTFLSYGTSPTLGHVLLRSIENLDEVGRERFGILRVNSSPGYFDFKMLVALWSTDQIENTIQQFISAGLLKLSQPNIYHIHPLLLLSSHMISLSSEKLSLAKESHAKHYILRLQEAGNRYDTPHAETDFPELITEINHYWPDIRQAFERIVSQDINTLNNLFISNIFNKLIGMYLPREDYIRWISSAEDMIRYQLHQGGMCQGL